MSKLPILGLVSHTRKVQSLYKRALRNLESWYDRREVYRYHAVLMRERFDKNKAIKDMRVAKEMLEQGEKELFENEHWHVRKFYARERPCIERVALLDGAYYSRGLPDLTFLTYSVGQVRQPPPSTMRRMWQQRVNSNDEILVCVRFTGMNCRITDC